MARYAVFLVLACVYIVGAMSIVRNEGISYRASLKPADKVVAARAPTEAPGRRIDSAEDVAGAEASPPAMTITRPAPSAGPSPAKEVRPRVEEKAIVRPSETPLPKPTPPPSMAVAAKTAPSLATSSGSPSKQERDERIARWTSDPFWSQPELAKRWDLTHFTRDDERQLGEQLNATILHWNPEDSGPGRQRVLQAAKPLLNLIRPKTREYQFFVLDSEIANAFSHPGGYIYVSRKLLEMIPEEDEGALQFVLAHEIAHVEANDALTWLNARDIRRYADGTIAKLYFVIIPLGYPNEVEYRADSRAYTRLKQLHRSDHEGFKFLHLLDGYAKRNGFGDRRGKLEDLAKLPRGDRKGDQLFSPIENHLRSHPAAFERLDKLKEFRDAAKH